MKSFSERNPMVIGAVGVAAVVGDRACRAELPEVAVPQPGQRLLGLLRRRRRAVHRVPASKSPDYVVGKVSSIELDGPRVLVKFKVDKDILLGDRTEAQIKTKSLLGTKILDVLPRGEGQLDGHHPDRPDDVALPAARRAWRPGHHHQRTEHQPAVGLAGHAGANLLQTPRRILKNAVARGGAVLRRRSTSATPNCATCSPTRTKRPACWPSAPTRWSA